MTAYLPYVGTNLVFAPVQFPFGRVVDDVFPDSVQFVFVAYVCVARRQADDVFVIIALP